MNTDILVVDDEQDFLESVRRGLITSDFQNIQLENIPEKAAGLFRNGQSFDIVLIDVNMPRMSGVELLELIKEKSPHTQCIMVTAVDEARVATECLKKGADDYLIKPILREDLIRAINHSLEKRNATKALRQSEERYRSLVESTTDGFFILDAGSKAFLFLNLRFCELCGYDMKEALDFKLWDLLFQEEHESMRRWSEGKLLKQHPGSERRTYTLVRKDGSKFRAEFSMSPVTFEGKKVLQGTCRDITGQERLQKQLEQARKMETIGTLTTGVAHNFRNVLAAISLNTELIRMASERTVNIPEITGRIFRAIERGNQLVKGLTLFSRRQSGALDTLNLTGVIQNIYRLFSNSVDKGIVVRFEAPEETLFIKGDRTALRQVFVDLFTNAADAMPGGGVLEIEIGKEKDTALVLVSDTGEGMDRVTLERCFDPFFTTKEVGKGTGLGLSTAYGIIKDHGGEIRVHSELNKGTTFKIYLPLSFPEKSKHSEGKWLRAGETGISRKSSFTGRPSNISTKK